MATKYTCSRAGRGVYSKLTARQALALIKKAVDVRVSANMFGGDVEYVCIAKKEMAAVIKSLYAPTENILCEGVTWKRDSCGVLYIN